VTEAIYGWKYRMESNHALNRRSPTQIVEGFLISYAGGYGCIQPWPVFGHATMEEHWSALAAGASLPLLDQALACAKQDAAAREAGISWWTDIKVPLSHATVTDLHSELPQDGGQRFTHAKLKASIAETDALYDWAMQHPGIQIRLDYNEIPTIAEFDAWWRGLDRAFRDRIDWIEDPFAYNANTWSTWRDQNDAMLAVDRGFATAQMSERWIAIWKPAWQPLPQGSMMQNVVVTSAMDHPVGQAWAAFCAAQAGVQSICGLRTDHLFARDAFIDRMGPWSPAWPTISGTGMGFDDLLEKIPWTRIR
jgi:O-succinylbenzoate synthase